MTERLWAGWRMAYLRQSGAAEGNEECLFCSLQKQEPSSESLVLEKYESCFAVLNAFPYTGGHAMVAPYAHTESPLDPGPEARAEILAAVERIRRALAREYGPQGFNIGANLGRAAGAGVLGHLHWHIVPRWQGDTNFMPVTASTRVIPEALPDTYARVLAALIAEEPEGVVVTGRGHGS